MDSTRARQLYLEHANAMAYIEVQKPDGTKEIGSAFHIGEGVFVTARHLVEKRKILKVQITEPVPESMRNFLPKGEMYDALFHRYEKQHKKRFGKELDFRFNTTWKKWLKPLKIAEGPYFATDAALDVAAFRVHEIDPAAGVVKLGFHLDDWIYRTHVWHLSDAIVLGYPPITVVDKPLLVAARAEIHTYFTPKHVFAVHFLLSAVPRGGFSGGVAILEEGYALGLVTEAFVEEELPTELGFFAVLSIEGIVKCLMENDLYPEVQRKHHDDVLGMGTTLKTMTRSRKRRRR
jgi:hypothetical protein